MNFDDSYPYIDKIDFSKIHVVFRELPLFDDMFLNMQAMNIAMVDSFITEQEYALLREYFDTERTPMQQALFVSAQSQMWIFALYELLRTWKQRARKLRQWKSNGGLEKMLRQVEEDSHNLAALMRTRHIKWVLEDDGAIDILDQCEMAVKPAYEMTSAIRMNLAKHEVQGKPNKIVRAPGYGRINYQCGALDYELDLGNNSFEYINRRDIADSLRQIKVPSSENS